jgi:predicted AlkP superfamily pyrophosphatase or phosphodiesterase
MRRTAVLNVVGLSRSLLGTSTPNISALAKQGQSQIRPAFPAVTCTAQSNYLTGERPTRHGIVANGWYDRSLAEVQFWKQSNHLVQAPKLWDELRARDSQFTCAKLFWWYNMYASVDYSITPRPLYPADGRKVFDIYTAPFSICGDIKADLGPFPFPGFWGPAAGVGSSQFAADAASRWIAEAAKWIERKYSPTLSLVYLPHLDYSLQRLGPGHPDISDHLQQVDRIVGDLLSFFRERSLQVVLLSEYGITPVNQPIHLNRAFRQQGWLAIKEELGLELLDCGASQAFAVADHQVAHVYLNDLTLESEARKMLAAMPGVEHVLGGREKAVLGIDHPRAGDLMAVAAHHAWFTYYYWLDDQVAPDFARTVDIRRKPGYDPVELFLDPAQKLLKLKIAWRLLQKRLGFRVLMDVVPLQAELVKGSHGRAEADRADAPLLLADQSVVPVPEQIDSTEVYGLLRRLVLGP